MWFPILILLSIMLIHILPDYLVKNIECKDIEKFFLFLKL